MPRCWAVRTDTGAGGRRARVWRSCCRTAARELVPLTGTGVDAGASLSRPVSRASRRDQPTRNAGLMNQCSLLWTGEQVSWWTRAAPSVPFRGDAGEVDPGGVAVVDVPGEHADRRRRPLTGIAGRDPSDQPGEPVEGVVEGLPVLEVGALADRLGEPAAPAGPVGRDLVDGLHVAERVGEQPGQRGAETRWSTAPSRICCSTQPNSRSPSMRWRPSSRIRPFRESIMMKRLVPRSQRKLNRRPFDPSTSASARSASSTSSGQMSPCGVEDAVVVGVGGQFLGGEVAQVLVDPVGRQRRADPLAPPRLLGHLLAPYLRGVPVVVDVVVVEDHRGGDAGHQPAHLGVGPGVAVEPDVLVVADDLVVGPVRVVVAAPGDAAAVLRGELVGVDLVAEQQQRVGPLLRRLSGHAGGVGVQRVDAELAGLLGDDDLRIPAGPEDDPVLAGRLRDRECARRSRGTATPAAATPAPRRPAPGRGSGCRVRAR